MLGELANEFGIVKETFEEASEVLAVDMWELAQNGPEEELKKTEITQPIMLIAGVAVWRAWCAAQGPMPALMAGHSLGEYTALVAAESIQFSDAVQLVQKRGRYMQEAVPLGTGSMAAILGLDDEQLMVICEQVSTASEVVAAANFNAPGQVVLGGHKTAVDRAIVAAKEAGAKRALPVAMSAPSHCPLMIPAAERLAVDLRSLDIKAPAVPIVNNVAASIESDVEKIRSALIDQVSKPVRWVDVVKSLAAQNTGLLIECGPGKALTGLCKRTATSITAMAVNDSASLDNVLTAQYTCHGHCVSLCPFFQFVNFRGPL